MRLQIAADRADSKYIGGSGNCGEAGEPVDPTKGPTVDGAAMPEIGEMQGGAQPACFRLGDGLAIQPPNQGRTS